MGSIALQETAIANLLNADGAKIQQAVALTDPTSEDFGQRYPEGAAPALADLLSVNDSVGQLMSTMATMESSLREKLNCILLYLNSNLNLDESADCTPPAEPQVEQRE